MSLRNFIVNISITKDDITIIVTCSDGYISLFDRQLTPRSSIYHVIPSFIFSSALSPNDRLIATALRNNNVHLFDIPNELSDLSIP